MSDINLRSVEAHFSFGENWKSFSGTIDDRAIAHAEIGLRKLFPNGGLQGCRFLDIGCGSGLSMLAARRLGAAIVDGVDIDPTSVETARALLAKYLPQGGWNANVASVFDLVPTPAHQYDIVHSWGVLHHTGDLVAALAKAATMVPRHGRLALGLYRRTPLCWAWRLEKRFYRSSGPHVQAALRAAYKFLYCSGLALTGRGPGKYISSYRSSRGMSWHHDVHDWLGGYPYESVGPREVRDHLERLGLAVTAVFEKPAAVFGLFGSHCDEFVAVRA